MQMQLKLSGTGNNHLGLAITIMEHLNQSRTRKINPQIRLELTTTFQNRLEASNTLQNNQEPYKNSQKPCKSSYTYPDMARFIYNWP